MPPKLSFKTIFLVISLLTFGSISGRAAAPAQTSLPGQVITVQSSPLKVADREVKRKISAPAAFLQLDSANATTAEDFIITYTGEWSDDAKTAFDYAASIWSFLIDPSVKITINAHSDGSWGASALITLDYPAGIIADSLYPRTLVNHLSGYDLKPDDYDFEIYYSADSYDWYYGTDGNPQSFEVDFVSVILHEIGHGLGFVTSFFSDTTNGWWGKFGSYPIIYDTFIVNGAGQSLIDTSLFPNYSPELRAQLESDNIYFDGPMTRAANQNLPAKLQPIDYSVCCWPSTPDHLNEIYDGTANQLMIDTIYPGESIHDPGPIALGILADLGWTLSPNLPVFYPLPSQMMLVNTQQINAIDLWDFIPAEQSPGTDFTFAISNTPAPGAGVSLHDNRYIDLVPVLNWLGTTMVTIKATNLQGISASQSFKVFVVAEIHSSFLPTITR